jgi:hypothetical protein
MKPKYIYQNELLSNLEKADVIIKDYIDAGWHLINVWTIDHNVAYKTTVLLFRKEINVH